MLEALLEPNALPGPVLTPVELFLTCFASFLPAFPFFYMAFLELSGIGMGFALLVDIKLLFAFFVSFTTF